MNQNTAIVQPEVAPVSTAQPPEGSQDWQLLVTEGHVRGHRLLEAGKTLFWPALLSGLLGAWCLTTAVTNHPTVSQKEESRLPEFVLQRLVWDWRYYAARPGSPDTRLSYVYAWLEDAVGPPQRGLTTDGWTQLVKAATKDVRQFGARTVEYTAIPDIVVDPKVTRPERALKEFRGDLARGIVAIPEKPTKNAYNEEVVGYIAAWVESKFAFAVIPANPRVSCITVFQEVDGCATSNRVDDLDPFNPNRQPMPGQESK